MSPSSLPIDLSVDQVTNVRPWTGHREPSCTGDRFSVSLSDAGLGVFLCGVNSPDDLLLAKPCPPLGRVGPSQLGLGKVHWPGVGGSWIRNAAVCSWESYPGSLHLCFTSG